MKVLIVGSGGREHAIAWKISQNSKVDKIYAAPGNAYNKVIKNCENINLKTSDDILNFALKEKVDLTIVGSEELLVDGIVDKFQKNNLIIFGPNKEAAMLEGSKAFAKDFMQKYGVKTAKYGVKAIIQPSGSVNDKDSIEECDKNNISMIFSKLRHFKH